MTLRNERMTQDRVVALIESMGYRSIGNLHHEENENVRIDDLKDWLTSTGKYDAELVTRAVSQFKREATMNVSDDLYKKNKEVYSVLRYGVNVRMGVGEHSQQVMLIDWDHPENNDFAVAEEVTVVGENTKRPDVVLYVNGIALGVIELKRASISVAEGIRQNLGNQDSRFIKPFFSAMQLVMAGNDSEGLKYGTIGTPERFYLSWKDDLNPIDALQNRMDEQIRRMLTKERLLDIIRNFVVYDAGVKKLCRPNQYFGVKAAQARCADRDGGIIWHTQGSGKSLTMVWLAKWIKESQQDARVLIITDRTELDEQIQGVFSGVEESIHRTRSGHDLLKVLNETTPSLICSLIHKFGSKEEEETAEILRTFDRPADFSPKGNLFVFIDECHRTQSGELHQAMKELLPGAMFIGFTGTPLLKKDKKKSIEVFGSYIHTYKFNEAVEDGVVLDLLYEARDVEQKVKNQSRIDAWFDAKTSGMNDIQKAELKKKWGTMKSVLSSKSRLNEIAFDIQTDFDLKPQLRDGKGNAMLVATSIYEACRYYEIFQGNGFKECAIVTSFEPSVASIRGEETGHGQTMAQEQFRIYEAMLNGKTHEEFELEAKKTFKKEPAKMKLLIVVDKLLTGFDAPSCTYLYIDKKMRDHGLFQAICRVNRTDSNNDAKRYGYIVDYMGLFGSLNASIYDYTSESFDSYDEEDIDGLLKDRLKVAKERLDDDLEKVESLCMGVEAPRKIEQFIYYFCGDSAKPDDLKNRENKRLQFYKGVVSLIRSFNNVASEMEEAGYSKSEAESVKQKVLEFTQHRDSIKHASGDFIDLKSYEPDMRLLLDQYLAADPSRILSNLGEESLLAIIAEKGAQEASEMLPSPVRARRESVAEALQANVRSVITSEMPLNPVFYDKMSKLLSDLIDRRRKHALEYESFLRELEAIAVQIHDTSTRTGYPPTINTQGKQAIYDCLEDEDMTVAVDEALRKEKPDGWQGMKVKERAVEYLIASQVKDEAKAKEVFELVKNQPEYR
jgi:type I restriction enzyme R subunit